MVILGLATAIENSIGGLNTLHPQRFIDKARELIENYPDLRRENVIKIKFICGMKSETTPRIFFKSGESIAIEKPDGPSKKMLLAALLYTIGRLLDVEVNVLYNSPAKSSEITTKHQKQYSGRLQRKIDNLMDNLPITVREAVEKPVAPEPKPRWIGNREVTEEQHANFGTLDPQLQADWKELSQYVDRNGKISEERLVTFRLRSGLSKEDVFRLNEVEFGEMGLNFDIDYGSISYFDHFMAILDLEAEVDCLESKESE